MKRIKKLNSSETAVFCGQLSLLLPAGITPLESIRLMSDDSESAQGKVLLAKIEASLTNGAGFYEALASTDVFPEYMTSMVLLGEESGKLDIIMKNLAVYYERQNTISETVKNAISYPFIMICLMSFIMVVLLSKVLPIFSQVFFQLDSGLNDTSIHLIRIGENLRAASGFLMLLLILAAISFFILAKSRHKSVRLKHMLYSCRVTKHFFLCISYSRFADVMSMITSGGMDIFKGLELSDKIIDNHIMKQKLEIFRTALLQGESIPDALKKSEIFQAQHRRMIQTGYKSGSIDKVFSKLSEYYKDAALSRLQRFLGAVEPTLVIIFSLTVGIILMSVIMPLIGIMSGIGQ